MYFGTVVSEVLTVSMRYGFREIVEITANI